MNRVMTILAASTMLCLSASCDKEEKKPEPVAAASAPATPPAAAPAAPAPAAPAANETIPVAADFEEEAEKSITPANYKSELDSIEKELK
jgi:hypothetical protein